MVIGLGAQRIGPNGEVIDIPESENTLDVVKPLLTLTPVQVLGAGAIGLLLGILYFKGRR
jgi:hypothetical protein